MEGEMLQHVWYQKLRQLCPKLKVCQFSSSSHLPGIYYIHEREGIFDICATDKDWVPALPEFDNNGKMIKSGYRRVIMTLLQLKLTTPQKVKQLFPGFFECHYPKPSSVQVASTHQRWCQMMSEERKRFNILGDARQVDVQDKIVDKMKEMEIDNFNRRHSAALSGDQFVELSNEIQKDMPDYKKENLDKAKFDYDKAVGKRKAII
jgi:hypothetical protein